ncbi:AAA family ATPase [Nitrosopumilus sp.]|uniref:adenylate kinase family protein n=1 Tax=Nitrosopumilus sp. TaxID=2024843 RepID=UPI00247D83A9|nr:AAA family ATPase [Nitrosopumilus sp.]MCV0410972.1 AAA family ATPase [Nitrosopumilus sp.]
MSIVITGNPGVGKHTVAEKIAQRLGLVIFDINKIAKDAGLFEENQDTNDVDTERLEKIIAEKISENNLIIGHLAPYVLEKNQVKKMIILRRSPYDLIKVYKERGYSDEKIRENTGSEILGIISHDAISKFEEKTIQIDITGKTIQEAIEKVRVMMSSNEGDEKVDWLDLVTKNNDLQKFFAD